MCGWGPTAVQCLTIDAPTPGLSARPGHGAVGGAATIGSVESTNTELPPAPASPDLRWAVPALVLSVIGFAASAVLVVERLAIYADSGHRSSCDINTLLSCGTVMRTPQAEAFGFPNPLLGIVAYAVLIATCLGVLAGARFAAWYWWLVWTGILAGSLFTLWLWWQTTFVINALCLYCMIVWCAQTLLLALTTARNARAGLWGRRAAGGAHTAAWTWLGAAAVLVVIFGVITVRFATAIFA